MASERALQFPNPPPIGLDRLGQPGPPGALRGLLADPAPRLDLLRIQTPLAAVRAELGLFSAAVSITTANVASLLQRSAVWFSWEGVLSPGAWRAWHRQLYRVSFGMPVSRASCTTSALGGGSRFSIRLVLNAAE